MTAYLEPERIYTDFINENISKEVATDFLIIFIENSDFHMRRIESLEMIDKIGLRTEKLFKTLENWVVSDEMQVVRAIALKIIVWLFPKKSVDTLEWVLSTIKHANEFKNHFMFATLFDLIYWSDEKYLSPFRSDIKEKIDPFIQKYVKEGVILNEAVFLALFEIQYGNIKIRKVENDEFQQINSNEHLYYRINDSGNILGIYITGRILFIPEYLYELKFLEELELKSTFITTIPESVGELISLKALNLGWNHIKTIPDSIKSLLFLKNLNLCNNKIKKIPNSISSLRSLEKLELSHNKLKSIPDSIGALKNLTTLYLCRNKIDIIPDSIISLNSLKLLDLWNNNIQILPDSIGELNSLETLNLGHNKIQAIPNSISYLQSIQKIDLRFNYIEELPESIASPAWLEKLVLEGNKIKNLNISKDR